MEVAIIEKEAFKTLLLRLEQISVDIQFCRKWIEQSSEFRKEDIHNKEWLLEDEVVELLGVSKRTLARMRKRGDLKYSIIGSNKIIYYCTHIDEYLEKNILNK